MADYTWRQWENEQNEANNIHADDCYRWQAGIELAGGTWDGDWVDLDKTGKGLVTIDQFNALEQQIQSKVSSYTPKNYDPDSTVQIVPGVDGWNKVEDGILRSICTPDGVNRNWLIQSRNLPASTSGVSSFSSSSNDWTRTEEDGFGIMTATLSNTTYTGLLFTDISAKDDQWADKQIVFSMDVLCNSLSDVISGGMQIRFQVYGTNNYSGYTQKCYRLYTATNILLNPDDIKDGEWCRLNFGFTVEAMGSMDSNTSTEYSDYVYTCGVRIPNSITATGDFSIRKLKLELSDSGTAWADSPDDYGYAGSSTLTATPQSVEDSDEVAAPEADEIE